MSPDTAVTFGPETGERCTRHTTSKSRSRCSRARPTTPDAPVSRTVRRALPMRCGPAIWTGISYPQSSQWYSGGALLEQAYELVQVRPDDLGLSPLDDRLHRAAEGAAEAGLGREAIAKGRARGCGRHLVRDREGQRPLHGPARRARTRHELDHLGRPLNAATQDCARAAVAGAHGHHPAALLNALKHRRVPAR